MSMNHVINNKVVHDGEFVITYNDNRGEITMKIWKKPDNGYGYIVFNNFIKIQDINFDNLGEAVDKFLDDKPRLKYTIDRNYFNDGDYTEWYEQQSKNDTFLGTYEEYLDYLIEKYEEIIVTDDGCMYGEEGTMAYDMSYDEFGGSPQIFFKVAHELDYTIEQY